MGLGPRSLIMALNSRAISAKRGPSAGAQVVHLHTLGLYAQRFQGLFDIADLALGLQVAGQVVALALQAAGHINPVGPVFKGLEADVGYPPGRCKEAG
jgi:hypothetical protein